MPTVRRRLRPLTPAPGLPPAATMGMAMTIAPAGTPVLQRSPASAKLLSQRKPVLISPIYRVEFPPVRNSFPSHWPTLRPCGPVEFGSLPLQKAMFPLKNVILHSALPKRIREMLPRLPVLLFWTRSPLLGPRTRMPQCTCLVSLRGPRLLSRHRPARSKR